MENEELKQENMTGEAPKKEEKGKKKPKKQEELDKALAEAE